MNSNTAEEVDEMEHEDIIYDDPHACITDEQDENLNGDHDNSLKIGNISISDGSK